METRYFKFIKRRIHNFGKFEMSEEKSLNTNKVTGIVAQIRARKRT